jgi:magnesium chelatase family protein
VAISKSHSALLLGLTPKIITIEVDISIGLHSFSIVGLGDRSIEEAKDRISAAIKNSGCVSPKQKNQKIIISLAPADIRKEGSSFDLGRRS